MTSQVTTPKAPAKKRMVEQDIAKAICMITVVFSHIVTRNDYLTKYFYLLFGPAMIFFFLISGYNYKPGRDGYFLTIKKRFKQIIFPMFKYFAVIFVVMGAYLYIRGEYKFSETWETLANVWVNGNSQNLFGWEHTALSTLMSPTWFLKYMMSAYLIFYAIAPWALSKASRLYSVCGGLIVISAVFAHFNLYLPWGIQNAPAVTVFMLIGAVFGQKGVFTDEGQTPKWRCINALVSFALCIVLGLMYPTAGYLAGGMLTSLLGEPEILLATLYGVLGTCWMLGLGRLLAKVRFVSDVLIFIGQHTLPLLLSHMPISYIVYNIFQVPYSVRKGGVFVPESLWIFLITFVFQCLWLFGYEQIKKKLKQKKAAA